MYGYTGMCTSKVITHYLTQMKHNLIRGIVLTSCNFKVDEGISVKKGLMII